MTTEDHVTPRGGFTLIETLAVLVVIALGMLIALPRFADTVAQSNLSSARAKVISLYSSARASASSSGRSAWLHLTGNRVYVTASPRRKAPIGANTIDTLTPPENVYTQYGVSVGYNTDSVRIDPAGLGRDSAVIVLTKGSRVDTVRISQYGRVLK